jgi:cation-transporting ATPase E
VIANIERVARLFVTKTVWAATLAIVIGAATMSYPILPRQLTVIDALTIGIPGFVLSFRPSHDPARPGFLARVMRFSAPVGVVTGAVTMAAFALARSEVVGADRQEAQGVATIVLIGLGLVALHELMQPLDRLDLALLTALVALGAAAFTIPFAADFFLLDLPGGVAGLVAALAVVSGGVLIVLANRNQHHIAAASGAIFVRLRRRAERAT